MTHVESRRMCVRVTGDYTHDLRSTRRVADPPCTPEKRNQSTVKGKTYMSRTVLSRYQAIISDSKQVSDEHALCKSVCNMMLLAAVTSTIQNKTAHHRYFSPLRLLPSESRTVSHERAPPLLPSHSVIKPAAREWHQSRPNLP